MKEKNLYIFGNGLDISIFDELNKLEKSNLVNTELIKFKEFMQKNNKKLYCSITLFSDFFNLNSGCDQPKEDWSNFEMDFLNSPDELLDYYENEYSQYYNEDQHRIFDAYNVFSDLLDEYQESATKFFNGKNRDIGGIHFPNTNLFENKLPNNNSLYLNFNYTNTLERYFKTDKTKICYIHGKAIDSQELILGHNNSEPIYILKNQPLPECKDDLAEYKTDKDIAGTPLSHFIKKFEDFYKHTHKDTKKY